MNKTNGMERELANVGRGIAHHRMQTQETAQQLSIVAMRQWEKALTGMFALPAAAATGAAAGVLTIASWLERGFEVMEASMVDIGRRIEMDVVRGEGTTALWRGEAERREGGERNASPS